jgi:chitodextrinase
MRTDERTAASGQRPQGRGSLSAVLLLVAALAPLAPGSARAQGAPVDTVSLSWTAPGDDDRIGTAAVYDLRMSSSPIDESNWASATPVSGLPVPQPAGARQSAVVRGLTFGTTYWFAIKTADEAGNWSALSNVVRWDWIYDTAPPAAPSGIAAALQSGGGVRLTWSANSEPDLAGYTVYRALSAGGPFTALNGAPLAGTVYTDTSVPAGAAAVWYQVSASDDSGNESARSATAAVSMATASAAWAMEPVYPNPSGPGATVSIPLVVPPGAGGARIEIVNNVGQRVRSLPLGALAPGPGVVPWDGRNDAGREVAPGAYTAWLIGGSTRLAVRVVRVP